MLEFWEANFREKKEMWGFEPADAAITAVEIYKKQGLKNILIPGFGYGRNATVFIDNGLDVTGIEISETAIRLAKKHYGDNLKVYHGSVSSMPFDNVFVKSFAGNKDHQKCSTPSPSDEVVRQMNQRPISVGCSSQ